MSDKELLDSLSENKRRRIYIEKYHIDLGLRINVYNHMYNISNYSELLYNFITNSIGYCKCKGCDKNTKFISYTKGYRLYCSRKCSTNDTDIISSNKEKYINTCIERYGVTNIMHLDENKEKSKKSCIEKYGCDSYLMSNDYQEKMKKRNLEKYGVEYYQQSQDFKEKSKKSCIEKYGVDHHTKTDLYKEKMRLQNLEKYGVDHHTKTDLYKEKYNDYLKTEKFTKTLEKIKETKTKNIIEFYKNYNSDYEFISIDGMYINLKCLKCENIFEISKQLYYLRTKNDMICCTLCNPKNGNNISKGEKDVLSFIKSIYDGRIYENYVIDKNELDIYLPDINLGFEYNGLFWHSEYNKPSDYHLNKLLFCESKNIRLFNIWEDDWKYKSDIIKSMIGNKLGISNKIYARKCEVKEVNNKDYKEFLENNHIQGYVPSKIKIGLYYNNELVSLMTFGGFRKSLGQTSINNYYELLRFCNKLNTSVIGGSSKLLNYFIRKYLPTQIISYCDKSRSDGNLYKQIGFDYIGDTKINYYWCKKYIRYSRYSFRKDILVKNGADKEKTEVEIMHELKYFRVYDCGNMKFVMNF